MMMSRASLIHLMRRWRGVVVDGLLFGLVAVVGEEDHFVVDPGLEVDGAVPEFVEALEGFHGVLDVDVGAVVLVG
jgi:hypothetical protein